MVDFIIIGTQRGGTSSFYEDLQNHPQVMPAYNSDINFFDVNYSKGMEWYSRQFPLLSEYDAKSRPSGHITGEASSHYMYHPLVAERIKRHCPDTKFIALLRNPTDRAYDHFRCAVKQGVENLCFSDALRIEAKRLERGHLNLQDNPYYDGISSRNHSYLSHGFYAKQLKKWFEHFDQSNFLFVRSEDYFTKPEDTLQEAYNFLGLPATCAVHTELANVNPLVKLRNDTRQLVDKLYQRSNEDLCNLLGRQMVW